MLCTIFVFSIFILFKICILQLCTDYFWNSVILKLLFYFILFKLYFPTLLEINFLQTVSIIFSKCISFTLYSATRFSKYSLHNINSLTILQLSQQFFSNNCILILDTIYFCLQCTIWFTLFLFPGRYICPFDLNLAHTV